MPQQSWLVKLLAPSVEWYQTILGISLSLKAKALLCAVMVKDRSDRPKEYLRIESR